MSVKSSDEIEIKSGGSSVVIGCDKMNETSLIHEMNEGDRIFSFFFLIKFEKEFEQFAAGLICSREGVIEEEMDRDDKGSIAVTSIIGDFLHSSFVEAPNLLKGEIKEILLKGKIKEINVAVVVQDSSPTSLRGDKRSKFLEYIKETVKTNLYQIFQVEDVTTNVKLDAPGLVGKKSEFDCGSGGSFCNYEKNQGGEGVPGYMTLAHADNLVVGEFTYKSK